MSALATITKYGISVASNGAVSVGSGLYSTLDKGVNFTGMALQHMTEKSRYVPVHLLIETIKYGVKRPDPQGTSAMMYTIDMIKNGITYNLEVLYNAATNTIMHFKYFH